LWKEHLKDLGDKKVFNTHNSVTPYQRNPPWIKNMFPAFLRGALSFQTPEFETLSSKITELSEQISEKLNSDFTRQMKDNRAWMFEVKLHRIFRDSERERMIKLMDSSVLESRKLRDEVKKLRGEMEFMKWAVKGLKLEAAVGPEHPAASKLIQCQCREKEQKVSESGQRSEGEMSNSDGSSKSNPASLETAAVTGSPVEEALKPESEVRVAISSDEDFELVGPICGCSNGKVE